MPMMRKFSALLLLLIAVGTLPAVFAAEGSSAIEDVSFADPGQMQRYKDLIAELRCPMCLNANLAGSDAPIAKDLRAEIRKQIDAGKSDDEILAFLVDRYGEFILYRPRLHLGTSVLWFGPPILLIAGFVILRRMLQSRQQLAGERAELSAEEQQQLQALLNNKQTGSDNG